MNDDERLDLELRRALAWEADRAATAQRPFAAAISRLAARVGPEPSLRRPSIVALPGRQTAGNPAFTFVVLLALLLALLVGFAVVPGLRAPGDVRYTSDRHEYSLLLPRGWRVLERPGTWEPGAFIEANSPGVDYLEELGPNGETVENTYVYLSSQPVPDFMSFDEWAAGHDAVNELWQPCFQLQGAHETREVDGEPARIGAYRCEDFGGGGMAWATVQTLVAHGDRGYAIYVWPAAQGPDMPPLEEVRAESDHWLARFTFTR